MYKKTYGRSKETRANGGGEKSSTIPYSTVRYRTVPRCWREVTVKENSLKDLYKYSLELPEKLTKTVHTAPEAGIGGYGLQRD